MDFSKFRETITPEEYAKILDKVYFRHEPKSLSQSLPEISFLIALELLERYHNWLNG